MATWLQAIVVLLLLSVALIALHDVTQKKRTILRNFPLIGRFRYLIESVGPELRQYIVSRNDEERPFSRDQRRWVYASAKKENNYFGFGTDNDLDSPRDYLILKHQTFTPPEPEKIDPLYPIPCAKVMGAARGREHAFRPGSIFYISAMSYGSLSANAVEALNRGIAQAGGLHNTGEGGISRHHLHGGDLIMQLGTGYFGARDADGNFSLPHLVESVERGPVKAIEIKLSQGAKPGRGGVLPGVKVTADIAEARGVPIGRDCISPASHRQFRDVSEMLDFVEMIAEATGLPVGIKSAVGEESFWIELADRMSREKRGVDFITIDGGEGGTGAAPLVFADHVALPFRRGFPRVYKIFAERGLQDSVVFAGSGRLGFPIESLFAFAMGCDLVGVAREAMLAIGCIQAQQCHTDRCPAGVATQNKWLMRGLDPLNKSARLANYIVTLRKEVLWLAQAAGVQHPSEITLDHFELLDGAFHGQSPREVLGYAKGWGAPSDDSPLRSVVGTTR